ncbi:hypothetical protein [Solimonas soli]|uniref:hypothetical protein n=1 Tax=Solimonas soli TaxID=413479 RepID=UPI0004850670|nr:hypothetical protein [Solimonas soli]
MTRPLLAAALGLALLMPMSGQAQPGHAARGQHRYIYYPKKQIYYAPEAQLWFWREGDGWSQGAALPMLLQQYTHDGYNVYLDAERPYEQQKAVTDGYRRHRWTPYRHDATHAGKRGAGDDHEDGRPDLPSADRDDGMQTE